LQAGQVIDNRENDRRMERKARMTKAQNAAADTTK
jgi:hypothetical protein